MFSVTVYISKDSYKKQLRSNQEEMLSIIYVYLALYAFKHTTEKEKFRWNVYQMRLFVKFALITKLLKNEAIWLISFKHFYI